MKKYNNKLIKYILQIKDTKIGLPIWKKIVFEKQKLILKKFSII